MRERDLNRNFNDERELRRIKTILFPKKDQCANPPLPHSQQQPVDEGDHVRSEIDKLRGEITNMLARGGGQQQSRCTEHAYLDGISRLARELKSSAGEVREVFEEFLFHLPTKLASEPRSYTLHYHYSLLLQHTAWDRLASALKVPLAEGMEAIRAYASDRRELQERVAVVERRREERGQRRRQMQLGRALLAWRANGRCLAARQQSEEYLRDYGLEGEQRLVQSLMNLPLLVLMLEEVGRETADISELLLLDSTGERATKFMQEGVSALSSSLETVTQRSLLQSDRSDLKFSRFEVALGPSLTSLCVHRGEILFVSNLAKSPDYGQTDNLCYWQSLGRSSPPSLRGGAVLYPIFDANSRCIAVLRQYFYEGALTALTSAKLERICTFLELAVNLDQRMRAVARQREYHREGYYMKMMGMVRRVESAEGGEREAMKLLEEELRSKLAVKKMNIFRVESGSGEQRELLLRRVWGESEDCTAIVSIAHQLLKQHSNYIYLENRLLVYASQTLFDLHLTPDRYSPATETAGHIPKPVLPIELIVNSLVKVQSLLLGKERESIRQAAKEEQVRETLAKQHAQNMRLKVDELSLKFVSTVSREDSYIKQISSYMASVQALTASELGQSIFPYFYLECQLGKVKKERYFIKLAEDGHQREEKIPDGLLRVPISEVATLHCQIKLDKSAKEFEPIIAKSIELFMKGYLSLKVQKHRKTNFPTIQRRENITESIPALPTREQKKKWELSKLQFIYDYFQQVIQSFAQRSLECVGEVAWQKQRPSLGNFQDWKHSIYRLFNNSDSAVIDITTKNPILPNTEYQCLRALTDLKLEAVPEESTLMITAGKSRSKANIYENSFVLSLPAYYHSGDSSNSADQGIADGLEQIKALFLSHCQQFVNGVNIFNQGLAFSAVKTVAIRFDSLQEGIKRQAFIAIKVKSQQYAKLIKNIYFFIEKLHIFSNKLKCQSFNRVYCVSQDRLHRRRSIVAQHEPIARFCSIMEKVIFERGFNFLKANLAWSRRTVDFNTRIEAFCRNYQQKVLTRCLMKLHRVASQRTNANQLIQVIGNLCLQYCSFGFRRIRRVEGVKPPVNHAFAEFEQCRSFGEIRQKLAILAPDFLLILQVTSEEQIVLHSPEGAGQVDPISLGLINCYQAGPEGQFVWYYSLGEGETNFQVKDRLNTLSKCLQISLGNCRKAMGAAMVECSAFRSQWVRRAKARMMRAWVVESGRLQMVERNRLNDSLYQMGIEGKTIKEKLKAQEKVLRSHSMQNQELIRKQEEYRMAIAENNHQIAAIEENQIKLENTKSIYHTLHRRSVLKGIFLLWRVNNSELALCSAEKKLKANTLFVRTGIKAIVHVVNGKRREYLSELNWRLSQVRRRPAYSPKAVEKIEVMFQDRAARLVTFQSELDQQENSQQTSNRSDHSQSNFQHTKRQFDPHEPLQRVELSADEYARHANGAYKLNPKTLKFLKRMGKLQV